MNAMNDEKKGVPLEEVLFVLGAASSIPHVREMAIRASQTVHKIARAYCALRDQKNEECLLPDIVCRPGARP